MRTRLRRVGAFGGRQVVEHPGGGRPTGGRGGGRPRVARASRASPALVAPLLDEADGRAHGRPLPGMGRPVRGGPAAGFGSGAGAPRAGWPASVATGSYDWIAGGRQAGTLHVPRHRYLVVQEGVGSSVAARRGSTPRRTGVGAGADGGTPAPTGERTGTRRWRVRRPVKGADGRRRRTALFDADRTWERADLYLDTTARPPLSDHSFIASRDKVDLHTGSEVERRSTFLLDPIRVASCSGCRVGWG